MKKLGVNTKSGANLSRINENENLFKKPIEFNKNIRRLSFLNNKNNDANEKDHLDKCDKTKVKEINEVFKNCMVALSHNKICTRNAFDIRIIDHLEDLVNLNDEEINEELNDEMLETGDFNLSFTRASKAIEGATKVYGYRVEAIYDQTYNFLSNMNIAKQSEVNEELMDEKKNVNEISNRKMKKRKLEFLQESSTLAKSSDITMDSVTVSNISVDTFFLKLNSTYDHSSGNSYLLPNLILNNDLSIQFDGDIDACEYKRRKKMEVANEEGMDENADATERSGKSPVIMQSSSSEDNECSEQMVKCYKRKLFLHSDVLRDVLLGAGNEDFSSLNICPELDYFKAEINKHRMKRSDSKDLEDGDDDDNHHEDDNEEDDYNLNEGGNIRMHKGDYYPGESAKNNLALNLSGNMTMDNLLDDSDFNNASGGDGRMLNSSVNNNSMHFNDYKIEDLNIENVMQESLSFDNMNLNDCVGTNLNYSQSILSFQQGSNTMTGLPLPELMKSENKDFSLMNSLGGNFSLSTQNTLFFKNQGGSPRGKGLISTIPDEDTLWNRNVMNLENRLNAIDVNNKFNYHYYAPSKLIAHGNFRNLMDIGKGTYKNKHMVLNSIAQKKVKASFDVSLIDFENLYKEINDVELSTYDLWKKEKKKYVSNALFSIDQTSYIFETKDYCINCVNTVTDRIMKFSRAAMATRGDYTGDLKLNVVLNEVNSDFLTNDMGHINFPEGKNMESMFPEHLDDHQDSHIQAGLNDAIDKFYNMDFEDVWQNENENNLSKQESKNENASALQLRQSASRGSTLGNPNMENVAKFVDVSKIKKILCDIVKPAGKEASDVDIPAEQNDQIVPYMEEKTTTFKDIINATKSKMNPAEVNGTSIHMLFVCLLYTCNDQELLLEKIPNEDDFYVHYGLPVEYHVKPDDVLMLEN
ncbi:hypothetical protein, conserved in Apicomplexan species [Plasmodium knowlesi strain H]|uniref:Condensin complex subunit 2 n=3 Tax=Plasmodium knowlesi TaxID=5850 RepID=A0A5K1V939_PLAKH|nr:uncharacterized protein PKNH_1404200 [Plasmodium knowlesi strain H]OTN63659.1 Uncharacterized protein PKNOH_S140221300 [Plasmodium knowlesi]CAA9990641.1 condensin complex subunit 2, putative [Plasmodium knowlesi strain H]SBO26004.1 hypothetical protein, conserved in Apicomplexan species [Plasmodium knowlesi strain H]SBO28717.1 hypothetical protein, conserved in Apicomplexan species [Plasmodium knowlesi strain H]VVS80115.1 condensin complex subunit 2, putative [Plasmodium knowlesi strain H]|eukprot:XP_002261932.1 [Plasmodium knowlesi strain H]